MGTVKTEKERQAEYRSNWTNIPIKKDVHKKLKDYCRENGLWISFIVTKLVREELVRLGIE